MARVVRRPARTCLGCRRVAPQAALLRLHRTPEGFVEPDPRRRGGGRGAYLCPREECLAATLKRRSWAHVFRAPTTVRPETMEQLARLGDERRAGLGSSTEPFEGGS